MGGGHHDTLVSAQQDLSTTFLAQSFVKLPAEQLEFRIGTNGVTKVTTGKTDENYLLRDQKLREPMTEFDSPQVGHRICFLFHPK